jgi:hypothetical protein
MDEDIEAALASASSLLAPIADAASALARLNARIETAGSAMAEGLIARLALREAAGWLAHRHGTWIHPTDLGLRAAGLTGSITAASVGGRLRAALPTTMRSGPDSGGGAPDGLAEDAAVAQALRFARLWRRLAEHRSRTPLDDAAALRSLLGELGDHTPSEEAMAAWRARFVVRPPIAHSSISGPALPMLMRAGLGALTWRPHEPSPCGPDRLGSASLFLSACLWRCVGDTPSLALPIWSATPRHLDTLARTTGPDWLACFLATVTDAARRAGQELSRLQTAATRAAALQRTARSRLADAAALALRQPVLTASGVAERLRLTPQAALVLLKQLVAAEVLREATGRAAWRAFVIA